MTWKLAGFLLPCLPSRADPLPSPFLSGSCSPHRELFSVRVPWPGVVHVRCPPCSSPAPPTLVLHPWVLGISVPPPFANVINHSWNI